MIEDSVLLIHRFNTKFADGYYGLVGGKVEAGETALKAIRREVFEEAGLDIPETTFKLVHTLHRKGTESEFIALFFKANISNYPKPINKEPDKHDEIKFFNIKKLPENIMSVHKQAINFIQKKINYSEHGW